MNRLTRSSVSFSFMQSKETCLVSPPWLMNPTARSPFSNGLNQTCKRLLSTYLNLNRFVQAINESLICYFDCRLFSGLARAARMAWRQSVSIAMAINPAAERVMIHQLISI